MFGSYDNFDVQIRKEFLEELNKKMTKWDIYLFINKGG
jgi:hypothetical protein